MSEHIVYNVLYIAYHSSKASAASTVSSSIAGIAKYTNWDSAPSELFILKKSLDGLRRLKGTNEHRVFR